MEPKDKDLNTEQAILEAAEQEFLEKGFARTKTTDIAKRVGVNHAMLHYYFRSKINLFNMVFQQKIQMLANSLNESFDEKLPFFDKIRLAVGKHFDFVEANPQLLFFVYSEVINDEERRSLLVKNVFPKVSVLLAKLEASLKEEERNGIIRRVRAETLLMNIVSLNAITFLAMPLLRTILNEDEKQIKKLLKRRREDNIQFIISGLKK